VDPSSRCPSAATRAARVLTALGLVVFMGVGIGWKPLEHLVSRWAERELERTLVRAPGWGGGVESIELDLWTGRGVARGIVLEAETEGKVVRRIEAPIAWMGWSWAEVLSGRPRLEVVGIEPVFYARARPAKIPPRDVLPPEPGWMRWQLDVAFVRGAWIWSDPGRDPAVELRVFPVEGALAHMGNVDGPARLSIFAPTAGGGLLRVRGQMDLLDAHREAFDLEAVFQDLGPEAYDGAALSYAGVQLAQGRFTGRFAVTWDPGRQELPPAARFHAGPVEDLGAGRIVLGLLGRDLVLQDPPVERVALAELTLFADAQVTGSEPFMVTGAGRGLEISVRRSDLPEVLELPDRGRETLDQTLLKLPPFRVPSATLTGATVRFSDDQVSPPVELAARDLIIDVQQLDNVDAQDLPARLQLRGELVGGPLVADLSVEPLVWPPPLSVKGELQRVELLELADALSGYGDVRVEHGSITAQVDAWTDGRTVGGELWLRGRELAARGGGWGVTAGAADLELIGGRGRASALTAAPERPGTLQRLEASAVEVEVLLDRFFARDELVGTVWAHRPVIVARRPSGDSPPAERGRRWSLDLHATEGTLLFEDPTTTPAVFMGLSGLEAHVLGLGTLEERARWEIDGILNRGGRLVGWAELDAFGGPGSPGPLLAQAQGLGLQLDQLRDISQAYLGLQFARGGADAELWLTEEGGRLEVHGRGLELADPPVEALRADAVDAIFDWTPQERVLTGSVGGLAVTLDPDALRAQAESAPMDQALPELRVPHFEVLGGALLVRSPMQGVADDVQVQDMHIAVHDLQTGALTAGRMRLSGRTSGGQISIDSVLSPERQATLSLQTLGLSLTALNPWVRAATRLDVGAGELDLLANLTVGPAGELAGHLRTELRDVDLLQRQDLQDGLEIWLRSAAAGAALDLLSRRGTARIELPIEGTLAAPEGRVGHALGQALLRRYGLLREPPPEMLSPTSLLAAEP
jgi:hypothetical protein